MIARRAATRSAGSQPFDESGFSLIRPALFLDSPFRYRPRFFPRASDAQLWRVRSPMSAGKVLYPPRATRTRSHAPLLRGAKGTRRPDLTRAHACWAVACVQSAPQAKEAPATYG